MAVETIQTSFCLIDSLLIILIYGCAPLNVEWSLSMPKLVVLIDQCCGFVNYPRFY